MSTPLAVAAPRKLMTAGEFWDYVHKPENENRLFELIRGEVIELSRPTRRHGIIASNITTELTLYARRVRVGYIVSDDSGVILEENPDTVVGPDVAYFTDATTFKEVHPKWGGRRARSCSGSPVSERPHDKGSWESERLPR